MKTQVNEQVFRLRQGVSKQSSVAPRRQYTPRHNTRGLIGGGCMQELRSLCRVYLGFWRDEGRARYPFTFPQCTQVVSLPLSPSLPPSRSFVLWSVRGL